MPPKKKRKMQAVGLRSLRGVAGPKRLIAEGVLVDDHQTPVRGPTAPEEDISPAVPINTLTVGDSRVGSNHQAGFEAQIDAAVQIQMDAISASLPAMVSQAVTNAMAAFVPRKPGSHTSLSPHEQITENITRNFLPGSTSTSEGPMCRRRSSDNSSRTSITGLQQIAEDLIAAGISCSTTRAYKGVWERLIQFCSVINQPQWAKIPVSPSTVLLFLANEFACGSAGSTLASYSSALAYIHKMKQLPDPTQTFAVRKLITGAQKRAPRTDLRLPITSAILTQLVGSVTRTSPSLFTATLLACAFSMAFHGFFRIGELVPHSTKDILLVVQYSDLTVSKDQVRVRLRHSKNGLPGQSQIITLKQSNSQEICPVRHILQFLEQRGSQAGPFLSYPSGTAITRQWFSQQLNSSLRFIRLDPNRFKGHSFRIGAASEAAAAGCSDAQIRHMGRWRSDAFKRYIRLQ